MTNKLFIRIIIWRNIRKRILILKSQFKFYQDIIEELLDNDFINNNNEHYLNQIKINLLKAQNQIMLKK